MTDPDAEARWVLTHLGACFDTIDQGVILCFALALLKLDSLTDDQFVALIEMTLRKALKDVARDGHKGEQK